jgi:hypothetical protein
VNKREYKSRLNNYDKGNTYHKLCVLGFVTDDQHCDEHCHTAAERGEQKQRFFGRAQLNSIFLGYFLVINANNDRNYRNQRDIRQKYRQNGIVLYKFGHIFSSLKQSA